MVLNELLTRKAKGFQFLPLPCPSGQMTEWGTDQTKLLGREGDPQTCLKTEWPGLSTVFIYLVGSFILCQALCRGAEKKKEVGYWVRKTIIIKRSAAHV